MFKRPHLFIAALFLLLATSAQAQTPQFAVDKGVFQIGATTNLTLAIQTVSGSSATSFTIAPTAGYFVIPNLVIGGTISLDVRSRSVGNSSSTATTFGIGPYGAYYFGDKSTSLYPLIGAAFLFQTSDGSNTIDIDFSGGINYMVAKNIGLNGVAFITIGPREGATFLTFGLRGGISAFVW